LNKPEVVAVVNNPIGSKVSKIGGIEVKRSSSSENATGCYGSPAACQRFITWRAAIAREPVVQLAVDQ
jgi:hypothetical protein